MLIDEKKIENELSYLANVVIEITQDCNLRCKYCVYGESYSYYREFTGKKNSISTIKKGLKFIHGLIKDKEEKIFSISFYGGEPLIELKLIKDTILLTKFLFKKWEIIYNISTNGVFLSHSNINFLIKNNFFIQVSLDGSRKNHDKKRVLKNGKGSYDLVVKNLKAILNINSDFFRTNVSINSVISDDVSLKDTYDYFNDQEIFKPINIKLSPVSGHFTEYYKQFPSNRNQRELDFAYVLNKIKIKLKNNKKLSSLDNSILDSYKNLANINIRHFTSIFNTCIFDSKLFLSCEGDFHICEKINSKFPIGNVNTGLDLKKMKSIIKNFERSNKKFCLKCEYKFLCYRCFVHFAGDGKFEVCQDQCERIKHNINRKLENYVQYEKSKKQQKSKDNFYLHQFVNVEKGQKKSVLLNFLNNEMYHVENLLLDKFLQNKKSDILSFIKDLKNEELILKKKGVSWNPPIFRNSDYDFQDKDLGFVIEVDDEFDLNFVIKKFNGVNHFKILYYGKQIPTSLGKGLEITLVEKNFEECISISTINEEFPEIGLNEYEMNKKYNNCWGRKIAITNQGHVRPCIYSEITYGDIFIDNVEILLKKAKKYWTLTKDEVKRCKDCEFRYACFDCREIAYRKGSGLYSSNPNCMYNPYLGEWSL